MKKMKWDTRANFALEYGFLGKQADKFGNYVLKVELIPLLITGEGSETEYEHYPKEPNAYGVYLRYANFAIEKMNLNPSEWLADFDNERAAKSFQDLVTVLLTSHLSETEKEKLAFELMPEQDAVERDDFLDRLQDSRGRIEEEPESQVSDKKIIDDQLRADVENKWKDIFYMGYSHNFLNDGRAEQWQLFLTPLNDYLMLGDEGDVQEYTYYSKEDLDNDIEALESHFHTFTEI